MRKILITILAMFLLAACADTHQVIKGYSSERVALSPEDSIYISVPEDGFYGAENYTGSGQDVAQILSSAFARHTRYVKVGRFARDYQAARDAAISSGQKYLVFPTILHWEDRATEWNFVSDKVEVKVEIVDLAADMTITSAIIKGKSGKATFGGDHPQDLLPKPMQEFVSSLYF